MYCDGVTNATILSFILTMRNVNLKTYDLDNEMDEGFILTMRNVNLS